MSTLLFIKQSPLASSSSSFSSPSPYPTGSFLDGGQSIEQEQKQTTFNKLHANPAAGNSFSKPGRLITMSSPVIMDSTFAPCLAAVALMVVVAGTYVFGRKSCPRWILMRLASYCNTILAKAALSIYFKARNCSFSLFVRLIGNLALSLALHRTGRGGGRGDNRFLCKFK